MFVRGHMRMGMCVCARVRRKYIFVLSNRTEFTGTIPPLVCSVCLNELQVCVRMRMRMGMCVRARVRRKYLFVIKSCVDLSRPAQNGWPIHHILRSVTGDGLEYNLKTCIPDRLANP